VGIARALMQRPDLLLVDEPTASLDPKTSRQIMRLIGELANERSTPALVNLHDVALARSFSDRILGFKAGAIVFDGTPVELTDDALTLIYGEEDWTLAAGPVDAAGDAGIPGAIRPASSTTAKEERPDLAAQP
jgi:phosphonate transport system ATP-binding protein